MLKFDEGELRILFLALRHLSDDLFDNKIQSNGFDIHDVDAIEKKITAVRVEQEKQNRLAFDKLTCETTPR